MTTRPSRSVRGFGTQGESVRAVRRARRTWLRVLGAGGLAAVGFFAYRRFAPDPDRLMLDGLRQRQAELWASLQDKVKDEPVVREARAKPGEVTVVVNEALLRGTLEEVAAGYVDQVELNLTVPIQIDHTQEVVIQKGLTFRGRIRARIEFHQITGQLRAGKPDVSLPAPDRIGFTLPVTAEEGFGDATLRFNWIASGLARVACRDFEVSERLQASLIPQQYVFQGQLKLVIDRDHVVATPIFPDVRYPLRFDLTPSSWKKVDALIARQTAVGRCSALTLVKDDFVHNKLRELVQQRGLKIRLPKQLFRGFPLPTHFRTELRVAEYPVELQVIPEEVRMVHGALWLSARIKLKTRSRGGSPPAGGATSEPAAPGPA